MRLPLARLSLALGVAATAPLAAQQPTFDFTIPNIMRGPEVYGRAPENVRWTPDGKWIYFEWDEPGTDWREPLHPFRVRAEPGATPERLTPAQMDSAAPLVAEGDLSPDGRLRVVSSGGDIYLVDLSRGTARRLTDTPGAESSPRFSADAKRVFFVRDENVFALDLAGAGLSQLTDIRNGPQPKEEPTLHGQRAELEAEQRLLFQSVRDEIRRDSIQKAERAARDARQTAPLWLEKGERVTDLAIAPSGRALLLVTSIRPEEAEPVKVPRWVTESGYTEEITGRTKVGDAQPSGRVAFVSLPSGAVHWLHVVPGDSAKPAAFARVLGWNDSGSSALVFALSRDFKTRYIERVGADSGGLTSIDVLHDSAWVDGPCFGCGGWLDGGARAWFVSEADGFAHIYTVAADGGDRRQLTSGHWEVLDARLSPDGKWFWMHTNEGSPFEQHFYRMPSSGGARERLTSGVGGHTVVMSPDARMMADVYSTANRPPELFLAPLHEPRMTQLTTSPTAAWLSFPWMKPAIVMVPASDGVQVPARIYRPADMKGAPNGAAVIFVHGAGYLHNVHNYWSDYAREYMFNQYLASRGYVVLDMDYRGSAGYGRDWRTAIYRHMGGRDLQDEVDGSRYLQKEFGVGPERVGIYGGSYGGFMTLMALFTEPAHFGAGAALRSVTDWAHYNHGYTARILNTPQSDTLAYRQSSPIYFADGLEDPLLMAHGMVDTNVNFQDIVRLTQRLIELGKTNWSLAVYPVESHGFVRPSSWTDEYRRIFSLFEGTIRAPHTAADSGSGR